MPECVERVGNAHHLEALGFLNFESIGDARDVLRRFGADKAQLAHVVQLAALGAQDLARMLAHHARHRGFTSSSEVERIGGVNRRPHRHARKWSRRAFPVARLVDEMKGVDARQMLRELAQQRVAGLGVKPRCMAWRDQRHIVVCMLSANKARERAKAALAHHKRKKPCERARLIPERHHRWRFAEMWRNLLIPGFHPAARLIGRGHAKRMQAVPLGGEGGRDVLAAGAQGRDHSRSGRQCLCVVHQQGMRHATFSG